MTEKIVPGSKAVCQSNFKEPRSNTTAFGEITHPEVNIKAEQPYKTYETEMLVQCLATADQCQLLKNNLCKGKAKIADINYDRTPSITIRPRKLF